MARRRSQKVIKSKPYVSSSDESSEIDKMVQEIERSVGKSLDVENPKKRAQTRQKRSRKPPLESTSSSSSDSEDASSRESPCDDNAQPADTANTTTRSEKNARELDQILDKEVPAVGSGEKLSAPSKGSSSLSHRAPEQAQPVQTRQARRESRSPPYPPNVPVETALRRVPQAHALHSTNMTHHKRQSPKARRIS